MRKVTNSLFFSETYSLVRRANKWKASSGMVMEQVGFNDLEPRKVRLVIRLSLQALFKKKYSLLVGEVSQECLFQW